MARFTKLLRTTSSVEELLGLADSAVKISFGYRRPHTWEWRELKATEGYHMDEVTHNAGVKTVNWMSHTRFSGRLAGTRQTIVALILLAGDEYWHAPYGEDSYDDSGDPLAPSFLWFYVLNDNKKQLFSKRFSVQNGNDLYETIYRRKTRT